MVASTRAYALFMTANDWFTCFRACSCNFTDSGALPTVSQKTTQMYRNCSVNLLRRGDRVVQRSKGFGRLGQFLHSLGSKRNSGTYWSARCNSAALG